MKRVAVYCGSSSGAKPEYCEGAKKLGKILAEKQIGLVYGGSCIGMMGAVADAVIEHGGEVIGVLPAFLQSKEIAHQNLTELHIVDSMHERKAKMMDLADGFVTLPGGVGTMEEFFEVLTWGMLAQHSKPCALYNLEGYYTPLLRFFDHMAAEHFVKKEHVEMVIVEHDPEQLINKLKQYKPTIVKKV